jgi:hypothetical protein
MLDDEELSASHPFVIERVVGPTIARACSARSCANMNASRVSAKLTRMPFIITCCPCTDRPVQSAESRFVLREQRYAGHAWPPLIRKRPLAAKWYKKLVSAGELRLGPGDRRVGPGASRRMFGLFCPKVEAPP